MRSGSLRGAVIRSSMRILVTLAALFASTIPAPADAGGVDLLSGESWTLIGGNDAQLETAAANGLPGAPTTELRVTVARAVNPFYLIQVTSPLSAAPPAGHILVYQFWGRAAAGNSLRAVIEAAGPPWPSVEQQMIVLTPQWKLYTLKSTVGQEFDQPLAARLQVGAATGVLEFARVRVEDRGLDPAVVAARAAIAPSAVRNRIRKYRMGNLTVRVVDAGGHPVPGAHVAVAMQRNAFLFGCNFFGLNPADNSAGETAYRNQFAALFNYATLPVYWGAFEQTKGQPNFAHLDAQVDWCRAHGIVVKAHPLVWHQVYPGWAPNDPDAAIPLLQQRVTDVVGREHDRIRCFDVVNEASDGGSYTPANGESLWIKRDGATRVVETALGWARSAASSPSADAEPNTFIYNDYETGQPNIDLLKAMRKDGRLPDAVGIQSHMHHGVWPLEHVWQVCQDFSQFGRPIHFTETTVLSGPRRDFDFNEPPATDWNTTTDGEAAQADYVSKFYALLFSYPNLRAITWWDFSDKNAWLGAPAGLIRKDMSPKPVYGRLLQMIRHDWWTDVGGTTNSAGSFKTRAFYGDYTVTADDGLGHKATISFSFPEGSGSKTVVMLDGTKDMRARRPSRPCRPLRSVANRSGLRSFWGCWRTFDWESENVRDAKR